MSRIALFFTALLIAAMGPNAARAQVVISEVYLNPPGFAEVDDTAWEYIEIAGRPGMDLTGYAIVLIKDETGEPERLEIDEAFSLDGCVLDERGIFVLVNTDEHGRSAVADRSLTANPDYNLRRAESATNPRWANARSFGSAQVPSSVRSRYLSNDGLATTFLLVRGRPGHEIIEGQSHYAHDYGWRKDVRVDLNRDGEIDAVGLPPALERNRPLRLSPVQIVDALAWRNAPTGITLTDPEHTITDVQGYIPDAISRVAFYSTNPEIGHHTIDRAASFAIESTTTADESFVAGEIRDSGTMRYITGYDEQGWIQTHTPTDPTAPTFNGSCDPEPDHNPFPDLCLPSGTGPYRFYDLLIDGFALTPGMPNAPTPHTRAAASFTAPLTFLPGDVNFDGAVNMIDVATAERFLNASLDDRDSSGANYRWSMTDLQSLLAVLAQAPGDVVTTAHINAIARLASEVPSPRQPAATSTLSR